MKEVFRGGQQILLHEVPPALKPTLVLNPVSVILKKSTVTSYSMSMAIC